MHQQCGTGDEGVCFKLSSNRKEHTHIDERVMCKWRKKELAKRDVKISELSEVSTYLSMSEKELVVVLKDLSNNIEEVCDVELAKGITEIYWWIITLNS